MAGKFKEFGTEFSWYHGRMIARYAWIVNLTYNLSIDRRARVQTFQDLVPNFPARMMIIGRVWPVFAQAAALTPGSSS